MKENIHTNALSRHADIYICDACGTEEALLKFMSNPLPVTVGMLPSDTTVIGFQNADRRGDLGACAGYTGSFPDEPL